ncbi:CYTH and CHAD domain-containing protein [Wenjunlia tyrosinilytica]|uniref:CHAD domain-containing protein n=1 Tax=Wenjunlia tyrosinilytica TaxID=1544741 RepID=A0A917ZFD3_9ACTN|nr:CYTH and CHAD domain-containing protein [Wenjunlia tyrosinilytica]GGO80889.1 CHAD domain-containing protein [Wenjunlia tyrosinilytica]
MTTVEVREIERKYEAPGSPGLPDLTGLRRVACVEDRGSVALDAVYYDTADLRLAAAGVTLRRRTGGEDAGWHLKLPAGTDARDEIRVPLRAGAGAGACAGVGSEGTGRVDGAAGADGSGGADVSEGGPGATVPPQLVRLVRSRTRGAPLVPVARLRSQRDVRHLLDKHGRRLAEVSYDQVTADSLPSGKSRAWAEIEVELAEAGTAAFLDAMEEHLAAAGARRSRAKSKLGRALGKRVPKPSTAPVERAATVGDAVMAYLREQVSELVALDPAVRRDLPDSVHRMRVAARRLRSALSTFRFVLDPEATRHVTEGLRRLGTELGADRDREVLTLRLYELIDPLPRHEVLGPVRGRLRTWATTRRSSTRRRAITALNSARYLELLSALDTLLAEPPLLPAAAAPAAEGLRRGVLRDYRRLAKRVAAANTDEERHEVRKAAKRARYAAEAARPVLGTQAKAFAQRMKEVQEVLGEYNDCAVTRAALRELAVQAHLSGENTFTYGLLHERETRRAKAAAARFEGVWEQAAREEHRDFKID